MPIVARAEVVPSTAVTADDHGAIVKVTAAFCTSVALVFLCARLLVRWPWARFFGRDDVTIALASVAGILQMGLVFGAVDAGLGKKPNILSHDMAVRADKYLFASNMIYALTLYLSRGAIVCFFMRLEHTSYSSRYVKALIVACPTLAVISLIIIGTQQYKLGTWILPSLNNGDAIFTRWVVVEGLGALFDIVLIMYPILLVKNLQMRLSMKVKVVLGIASRLPLVGISVVRMVYLYEALHSRQPFFAAVNAEIVTQAEMGFALVAATVPTLQIFLRAAKSSLLGETVHTQTGSGGITGNGSRKSGSRMASSFMKSGRRNSIELSSNVNRGGQTTTLVTKGSIAGSLASDSSERAIVMQHTIDVQSDCQDPAAADASSSHKVLNNIDV